MSASAGIPRVAVIGISGYGGVHLQLARECRDRGELEIVAATVINPADEAQNVESLRAGGCRIYADYGAMLDENRGRIDLCLIPTGIHWHARMTLAALRAGANVLVEKPLSCSTAEVAAIRQAERETGRFVAVGFQDYYEPGTAWLKEELVRGAIGEVQSVRFLGLWPRPRSYFSRNNWAGRVAVDGVPVLDSPLSNAFAHFVMLSLYFAARDREAAAAAALETAELFRTHAIENFDTGVVLLRTPEGVNLWFGASHACAESLEPEILITGTKGRACWRYETEAWWEDAAGRRHRRELLDVNGARRAMLAATLRRLRDPDAAICTVEIAGRHTAVIEALQRAGEVQAFPAELVSWSSENGAATAVPMVQGLDSAMREAFAAQQTLAGAGFRAAAPTVRR